MKAFLRSLVTCSAFIKKNIFSNVPSVYSLPKLENPLYKVSVLGKICIRLILWSTCVIKVNQQILTIFKRLQNHESWRADQTWDKATKNQNPPPPKKNPKNKTKQKTTPRHICCPVVNRFHGFSANFLQRRPRSIEFFRSVCPLANIASRIVVPWCQRHKCYLCLFMLFMSLMVHGKPGKTDLHVISI